MTVPVKYSGFSIENGKHEVRGYMSYINQMHKLLCQPTAKRVVYGVKKD